MHNNAPLLVCIFRQHWWRVVSCMRFSIIKRRCRGSFFFIPHALANEKRAKMHWHHNRLSWLSDCHAKVSCYLRRRELGLGTRHDVIAMVNVAAIATFKSIGYPFCLTNNGSSCMCMYVCTPYDAIYSYLVSYYFKPFSPLAPPHHDYEQLYYIFFLFWIQSSIKLQLI